MYAPSDVMQTLNVIILIWTLIHNSLMCSSGVVFAFTCLINRLHFFGPLYK